MQFLHPIDLLDKEFIIELLKTFFNVELKIGIDSGRTLCRFAKIYPDIFFVGIEVKEDKCRIAADRILNMKLNNACVVNMEALEFITNHVTKHAFNSVHIYFPTPYPNTLGIIHPNLEHRLICNEFTEQLFRVIKPLGNVRILTDYLDYYYHVQNHFSFEKWLNIEWTHIDLKQKQDFYIGTPTEIDYVKNEGRKIYPLQYIRMIVDH